MSQLDIKAAIKRQGLTINETAERLGMLRQGLHAHITGNPSVEVLQRIAAAIGCDVVDLFAPSGHTDGCRCPVCGAALTLTAK